MSRLICWLLIAVLCFGMVLFYIYTSDAYASSRGGQIIDKIYVPSRTYLVDYHGEQVEFMRSAQYTFVVAVDKSELSNICVNRKTYIEYEIGDEYYKSEEVD